jgi:unsaturated rhamnogalacturonyl hydrolase
MRSKIQICFFIAVLSVTQLCQAQTWVDTLDNYAREKYLPAASYKWRWTHAALVNTMIKQYKYGKQEQQPQYLAYIKKAMDETYAIANGKTPNSVASGTGLAFLYKVTGDVKYKTKAEKIYADYLKIRRTADGGVSHLMLFTELWDDTMFMVGEFLLAMYDATGEVKYLEEFIKQFRLHREKLLQPEYGLWVHGWDSDNKIHCTFCSQMRWANQETRKSAELWGRGNGWIIVTLSDALETLPKSNVYWNELSGYLKEMVFGLPALQDTATGHWYQLPVRNTDPDNWIESSCTAMFSYGIGTALRLGIVTGTTYSDCMNRAYVGLRKHSLIPTGANYLTTQNVCTGTCIGNKAYYFKRASTKGTPYGIGMCQQFGLRYELDIGWRK